MPSTPSRCTLPKLSLTSLSCGVALSVIGAPPRSTSMSSVSPALTLTMRCMSEKLSILLPSIDEHEVAGLEAGGRRGAVRLHGIDARGAWSACRQIMKMRGKDHDRQDEIGDRPGRHDRGARADRLVEEADLALRLGHAGDGRLVGHARGVVVAEELHVAAERDGGELPAGAVAVVEADEFRAETDRKSQHPHAAPARDQEVAELVEEHDDRQDEQKRDDIAGRARRQSAQARP